MGSQIIPTVAFGDKGTQLDILDGYFLATDTPGQDFFQFLVIGMMPQSLYLLYFQFIQIIVESFQQSIESHFRRIGYKREYGMLHIIVYRFQNRIHQFFAQLFSFLINIHVTSPAEIDTFEGTGFLLFRPVDLCQTHLSSLAYKDSLSRLQFIDASGRYIQGSLNDRALGCQYHDFIVHVPESRTNAPRIAHRKRLTATGHTADHIASIPLLARSLEDIAQINAVFYSVSDIHAFQTFLLTFHIEALHLAIQTVPHLFQHNICVGIFTRMLAVGSDTCENLIHIGHVEIAAQRQILGTPVVTAQERMHVGDTAFSGSGITQMPHIYLSGKGKAFLGVSGIMQLFRRQILEMILHRTEYLCYRP